MMPNGTVLHISTSSKAVDPGPLRTRERGGREGKKRRRRRREGCEAEWRGRLERPVDEGLALESWLELTGCTRTQTEREAGIEWGEHIKPDIRETEEVTAVPEDSEQSTYTVRGVSGIFEVSSRCGREESAKREEGDGRTSVMGANLRGRELPALSVCRRQDRKAFNSGV
ncbi:unnamed protein product [Pleuronectes platessa]|uniref:Uncharacterized protein n=1 Tax=Pleuronectes platessa TaxID=8262 RepID=A0A9N7Y7X3_PLEPL|nr:unnamed protein product [Pleuronectes platessa]